MTIRNILTSLIYGCDQSSAQLITNYIGRGLNKSYPVKITGMTNERDYQQLLKGIALRIRELRKEAGWTQEEAAEQGGFNYRYFQKLESGSYSPNLQTLHRLAKMFGIKVRELMP